MSTVNQLGKYQPYPDYKDSGVRLYREIPVGWHVHRLKVIVGKIESGTSVNAVDTPAEIGQPGVLKTSAVYTGEFRASENKAVIDEELNRVSCPVKRGCLIVSRMNTPELVGAAGLVKEIVSDVFLPDRLWQVHLSNVSAELIHYWTLTQEYRSQVRLVCSGTSSSMQNLSQEQFLNFLFPSPSYIEQRTIAAFLDYETARIDQLIAKQQQLIELLKEKRQAVISHAVTKGLNSNAPMKDSGVEWLGQVPEHWVVAGFKKFLGKIIDYRGKTPEKTDSGVFLVTARNIKNGVIDYSLSQEFVSESDYEEIMRRGKPSIGDVLFTTEAPLGEVAQVDRTDIALAQRIIKFCGIANILSNDYLKLYMQSTSFQQGLQTYATGSTALGIKADRLGYLRQLLPPIVEQSEIVEYVKCEQARYSKLISVAEKAISIMQERRTALISAAVTGKIDLRGWQPPKREVAA